MFYVLSTSCYSTHFQSKKHHVILHYFQNNYKGKLQLTHLWFGRNLSYLPVI